VRIVYTPETLYLGVICFDRSPREMVLSESRRDSGLDKVDSFRVLLDTFLDRQNAFVFGTTPAGAEDDAQVTNDGAGGDPAPGASGLDLGCEHRALSGVQRQPRHRARGLTRPHLARPAPVRS
jgi:hypothetical protein